MVSSEYHAAEQIGDPVFLFPFICVFPPHGLPGVFRARLTCPAAIHPSQRQMTAAVRAFKNMDTFYTIPFLNQRAMFYNFFQRDHPILPRSNKISHRQQKTVATEEKPR